MAKKFEMKNVFRATYGYHEKYSDENRYPKKLEKALAPYVVNGYLKTDIKSLAEVADIIDGWYGESVIVNEDQTITFYDTCY